MRGCERALAEHRIGLIQLEWNSASEEAVGADRRPVAELLGRYGYNLFRPDARGCLMPLASVGFGPDVFAKACLLTQSSRSSGCVGHRLASAFAVWASQGRAYFGRLGVRRGGLYCQNPRTRSATKYSRYVTVTSRSTLRGRLYEAYASQHAGRGSSTAVGLMYRRDIPPCIAGPDLRASRRHRLRPGRPRALNTR